MIARVKGTQDFLDLSLFNFIINQTRQHVHRYQFTEIATPILEHIELFKRSLGVDTDVVSKEMFIIDNRGQQPELCLRPEMTASIVRAYVEHGITQKPWKVFSWGPLFRYERPQKGRYRQFHQVSFEVIGAHNYMHDVQFIAMLDRLFTDVFKLDNYALVINFLGTPEDRVAHRAALLAFLNKHVDDLCETCKIRKDTNIMRVFDCKNEHCGQLYQRAPMITDYLSPASEREWQEVRNNLELLGVSYSHRPTLVRGLDYYSKTVFEFVSDNLGAQNAFCGGGRYDSLAKQLGAHHDQPSLGAAFGIERLLLLLDPIRDQLSLSHEPALNLILPLTQAQQPLALLLAESLRLQKIDVDVLLDYDSLKDMMRHANKVAATYVLIIGEDEQRLQTVTIKNMITGVSETVAQIDVALYLKKA